MDDVKYKDRDFLKFLEHEWLENGNLDHTWSFPESMRAFEEFRKEMEKEWDFHKKVLEIT
jgi:hypothetical protein